MEITAKMRVADIYVEYELLSRRQNAPEISCV